MQYIWSIYNLLIKKDVEYSIVFNTRTGSICRILNEFYQNACNNKLDRITIQKLDLLIEHGFIVNNNISEFSDILNESFKMAENEYTSSMEVTIVPSLMCNMRCNYCFERLINKDIKKSVMSYQIRTAAINYILNQTRQLNINKLCITWFGGEPLLQYKNLIDISKNLKTLLNPTIQFTTRLITNGYLLSIQKLKYLIDVCNLDFVQISIDGLKERYSRTRNVPEHYYERVIENVIMCSEYVTTRIRLNASPDNINELYEFVNQLEPLLSNKKNIHFVLSEIFNITPSVSGDTTVFPVGTFRVEFRKFSKYLHKLGFLTECYYTEKFYPIGCKYFLRPNVAIDSEGFLYKCEHHFGEKGFIIGNVYEGILPDKRTHIYYEDCIENRCKTCSIYPICKYATCSDYRQQLASNMDKCSCYELQIENIKYDILQNLQHFPNVVII